VISLGQLGLICVYARPRRLALFVEPLNTSMAEFEINTPKRARPFIAQIAHESGEFQYVREIASGAAYDTGTKAERLGNTPEADGDGERYRGRGLIQVTGRRNYEACAQALGLDLLAHPELLELPGNAARSAAWFWKANGLNELADKGDFRTMTLRINGGLTHYDQRLMYLKRAERVIK
jgi:putative chitinase